MSRTKRMGSGHGSARWVKNSARDGQGWCCPEGKSCSYCHGNKVHGEMVRRFDAVEAIEAHEASGPDAPHVYPHIGQDTSCRCWDCSDMWSELEWAFTAGWCPSCGSSSCQV